MQPSFNLEGRVAVVTGGGGGLGTMACEALARAGATVVIVGRNAEKCDAVRQALAADGHQCRTFLADITSEEDVARLFAEIGSELGGVDILVNNAGVTSPKPFLDLDVSDWDRIMDTSAKGTFLCTRAAARLMQARGGGRIVNLGSILSERGIVNRSAYSAAKAAVVNLTRATAIELGPLGICVNALGPTVIVTDLNRELVVTQPALYKGIVDRTPLGRLGETADLVGPLLFLASDASAFVTGQILYVDGGYTAS